MDTGERSHTASEASVGFAGYGSFGASPKRSPDRSRSRERQVDIQGAVQAAMAAEMAKVTQAVQAMGTTVQNTVIDKLAEQQATNERRFARTENDMEELRARVHALETGAGKHSERAKKIESRLDIDAVAASAPEYVDLAAWDREPDQGTARITCGQLVPKSKIEELLESLVSRNGLGKETYTVAGDELDRNFACKFTIGPECSAGTARRRVEKLLGSLKKSAREWEQTFVRSGEEQVQVYIGKDANRRQDSLRWCAKRARTILAAHFQGKRSSWTRRLGCCLQSGHPSSCSSLRRSVSIRFASNSWLLTSGSWIFR